MNTLFLAFANQATRLLPTLQKEDDALQRLLAPCVREQHFQLHRDSFATLDKLPSYLTCTATSILSGSGITGAIWSGSWQDTAPTSRPTAFPAITLPCSARPGTGRPGCGTWMATCCRNGCPARRTLYRCNMHRAVFRCLPSSRIARQGLVSAARHRIPDHGHRFHAEQRSVERIGENVQRTVLRGAVFGKMKGFQAVSSSVMNAFKFRRPSSSVK